MDLFEEKISEEKIFDGRIFSITKDKAKLSDGREVSREVLHHHGGVCVIALDDDNNVYMVKQFRYPYAEVILEVPAGKLEKGENPLECGMRELEEETGMTADSFVDLGKLYPTPAYVDEIIHCYYASGLHESKQHLDDGEFLEVEKIPLKTLKQMVLDGEIRDSKTQVCVLKLAAMKNI